MSQSPKDLVIKRLKNQLEKYKKKLEEHSYDNIAKKVEELEAQLKQKDNIIADLKETSGLTGDAGGDAQKIKTKLIVTQSKLRKTEKTLRQVGSKNEELERKLDRQNKKSSNAQEVSILKRQLRQEMETSDRLRAQINDASQGGQKAQELERKVLSLQQQLKQAKANSSGFGGASSGNENVMKFKNEVDRLQGENNKLKSQLEDMSSGGGGGPMATLRLKREITSLKSKIEMLEKDKKQMEKRYRDSVRKSEFSLDDGW